MNDRKRPCLFRPFLVLCRRPGRTGECLAGTADIELANSRCRPRFCGSDLLGRGRGIQNGSFRNFLLEQANRRSDFVLRYEGCGEKCILQPLSRALRRRAKFSRTKRRAESAGFWRHPTADGTASLLMVAEGEKLEKT